MDNRFIHTIHLAGVLSADAQGVVPMASHVGATLLEVAACAGNANDATLAIGLGGDNADPDAIMTAKAIGQGCVQLHGGVGVTMEYQIGHVFKRLTMIEKAFGDTDFHLDLLAAAGGLAA